MLTDELKYGLARPPDSHFAPCLDHVEHELLAWLSSLQETADNNGQEIPPGGLKPICTPHLTHAPDGQGQFRQRCIAVPRLHVCPRGQALDNSPDELLVDLTAD